MQFNLPRDQWIAISRAQVYDNTWVQTPTQGWMFAALADYHGGGAAAALEPLQAHLQAWNWTLATFVGAGVGTCYRGSRLYDTPAVEAVVAGWMRFWVRYRCILTEDIVHVRRPTGGGLDALMHVSSHLQHPDDAVLALAMVYNPSPRAVDEALELDLYYCGAPSVRLAEQEQAPEPVALVRDKVTVQVRLPPHAATYFVVYPPEARVLV